MYASRSSETTSLSLTKRDRVLLESGECAYFTFNFDKKYGLDSRTQLVLRVRETADPNPDQMKFPFYMPPTHRDLLERGIWYEIFPTIRPPAELNFLSREDSLRLGIPEFELPSERAEITKLLITLDKTHWQKLLDNGLFLTRWLFDRLQITYWEEGKRYPNV